MRRGASAATYGPDDNLRTQQLVVYGIYQLPFGRNQMFASNASRLEDEIIGGWQLSPVLNWSNGLPWSLGLGGGCGASVPGSAPCYPVGKTERAEDEPDRVQSADAQPRVLQSCRHQLRLRKRRWTRSATWEETASIGPGYFNTDLSLQKNFPIRETLLAQFRVDAYNAFNHINPGNPSSTNTGSDGNITGEPALGIYTNPRQLQFSLRVQF